VIVACEKVLDYIYIYIYICVCVCVTEIKSAGRYLYEIRCKLENVIRHSSYLDCRLIESMAQISTGQTWKDCDAAVTAV